PLGQLGLTVCYDLRFPELFSWLQREGADIITVPSAFTYRTGEAHWEVLLRARAIETQCFIIAPNQGGVHSARRTTWGHSMIIDPWGTVLGCHATGPGLVIADLDLAQLRELRASMPLQQHKRFSPTFTPCYCYPETNRFFASCIMSAPITDSLSRVTDFFLPANGLDVPQLQRVMESMLHRGADFADLYFQHVVSESWS